MPRLGVTQTTRDLLRDLLDDRRRDLVGRRGTMAWTGEHYAMHEQTAEEADALFTQAEAVIAFADACDPYLPRATGRLSTSFAACGICYLATCWKAFWLPSARARF